MLRIILIIIFGIIQYLHDGEKAFILVKNYKPIFSLSCGLLRLSSLTRRPRVWHKQSRHCRAQACRFCFKASLAQPIIRFFRTNSIPPLSLCIYILLFTQRLSHISFPSDPNIPQIFFFTFSTIPCFSNFGLGALHQHPRSKPRHSQHRKTVLVLYQIKFSLDFFHSYSFTFGF